MERAACVAMIIFFIAGFTLDFPAAGFAQPQDYRAIKELERAEKTPPAEVILRPNMAYDAEGFKDPFREPVIEPIVPQGTSLEQAEAEALPPEQPPVLTVQGIIWGGIFPQAIINNKVVKEGDTVEGAQILTIKKDGIIVLFKDNEYKISSSQGVVNSNSKP